MRGWSGLTRNAVEAIDEKEEQTHKASEFCSQEALVSPHIRSYVHDEETYDPW